MNLQELFSQHRSIRKYKSDPVPDSLLRELLQQAMAGASSSGNLTATSMVLTLDEQRRKKLYTLHGEQEMILQAPVVATFCADYYRMRTWLKMRGARDNFNNFLGFLKGLVDSIILAQNYALACESRGLGICYMGTTWSISEELIQFLDLPETVFPVTSLVIGYPDESPAARDRLSVEAFLHRETYHRPSPKELDQYYEERESKGWARYMASPRLKAMIDQAGIQNLAEFYTSDYKYPRTEYLDIARGIMQALQRQGFLDPKECEGLPHPV